MHARSEGIVRATCGRQLIVILTLFGGLVSCGAPDSPVEPTPICSFAISPAERTFASEGGSGIVAMTVAAGCTWTATSNADWIVVTTGATGSGSGSASYSVAANSSTQSRSATLTIGGQVHAVSQQGRPAAVCSYTLAPESATFGNEAGAGTFSVNAPAECAWTAVSGASWVVVTAGAQGAGNGTVGYTVAANNDVHERVATITVTDQRFTVRQGGEVAACQYSVGPVEFSPCMPGGSVIVTLTTDASCPWTAVPDSSWLSVPSGTSGTGSRVITIAYPDNYDAPRQGIVMVRWPTPTAGQNIRVAQAGCHYAVSRAAFNFTAAGGSDTFVVLQESDPNTCGGATQDRCIWTAQSTVSWITITSSMPRAGDNPVAFTVNPMEAKDGPGPRVGNITVRDKVVVITQTR